MRPYFTIKSDINIEILYLERFFRMGIWFSRKHGSKVSIKKKCLDLLSKLIFFFYFRYVGMIMANMQQICFQKELQKSFKTITNLIHYFYMWLIWLFIVQIFIVHFRHTWTRNFLEGNFFMSLFLFFASISGHLWSGPPSPSGQQEQIQAWNVQKRVSKNKRDTKTAILFWNTTEKISDKFFSSEIYFRLYFQKTWP